MDTEPKLPQSELRGRIQHTFEEHFLVADLVGAEAELLAIVQGCDETCSRQDLAAAWMYMGIVRASGESAEAASAAFEQALVLDPEVALDMTVSNPTTVALFAKAGGQVEGVVQELPTADERKAPRSAAELRALAAKSGLVCGPGMSELQTRRALPIWCARSPGFWRVTLRYLAFNADGWVSLRMKPTGPRFQVEVPCQKTELAGPLKYYVTVTDTDGALVATLGSRREPLIVQVAEEVESPPPAFPGRLPPERCAPTETCPPDFPGCHDGRQGRGSRGLGEACEQVRQCQLGLTCLEGICEQGVSCDVDSDCSEVGARCVDRVCQADRVAPAPAALVRSLYGLHFAADLGLIAGSDVCSTQDTKFDCRVTSTGRAYPRSLPEQIALEPGEPGDPYPGASVGGLARGSLRLLLSYDREVLNQLTLGARLGVAFNGAPSGVDETPFLPVHLEGRVSYWLFPAAASRVQPFFFLAGGLAQVDLSKELEVQDCSTETSRQRFEDCISAEGDYETPPSHLPEVKVTATQHLGRGFASLGVGAFIPMFKNLGVVPAISGSLMFPEVGFVVQPSVGLMAAF